MGIDWVRHRAPALQALLDQFRRLLPEYLPETASAMLFGGIPLGGFSPPFSDIDLIAWVDAPAVIPVLAEQAERIWRRLAEQEFGELIYLYLAPTSELGGPMNPAGGGSPGGAASLRVYRQKARLVEGYPLSLPDTVSLRRHGVCLLGRDIRNELPAVPDDWPAIWLRIRLGQLERAASGGVGPYGPDPEGAAATWGPDGIMSEVIWYARHLYSITTGEILSKEDAAVWYLSRHPDGPLAEALRLVLGWRRCGEAPGAEVVRVARLVRPATAEFLGQAVPGSGGAADLLALIRAAQEQLAQI